MRKTTNYNLSQYDATDRVTRSTFNADNAAVDAALKAIATAAANAGSAASAAQTTANSASSAAATAQSTANTAKTNAATAQSTANTALAAARAAGKLRLETGTYTGDGNTNHHLSLSADPLLLIIVPVTISPTCSFPNLLLISVKGEQYGPCFCPGVTNCHYIYTEWQTDNKWIVTHSSSADACGNAYGVLYRYFAFFLDET